MASTKLTAAEKAIDRRERLIFNSSLKERNKVMEQQGWRCAICTRPFKAGLEWKDSKGKVRTDVLFIAFHDHDHKCCPRALKKFCGKCNRGYLCFLCNKFLVGVVEKQNLPVNKLLDYVNKWGKLLKENGAYLKAPASKKAKGKKNGKKRLARKNLSK